MVEEYFNMAGYVKWHTKYSGYWVGTLREDPSFEVRLMYTEGTRDWNLVVEKDYDAYLVQYPRTKKEAAYLLAEWIDRGMQMEEDDY